MGKKFFLGPDVIRDAGEDAIIEFKDSEEEVINELYFDFNSLEQYRDEPLVRLFLTAAQDLKKIEGLKIHSSKPNAPEDIDEVISDDPFFKQRLLDGGYKHEQMQRPRFLLENPEVLKKGILKSTTELKFRQLPKHNISLEDAISKFGLNRPDVFFNQFRLVKTSDGKEGLYIVKQDVDVNGFGEITLKGVPYLRRIEDGVEIFSKKNPFEDVELDFGVKPNHLNQYLAYNYLLLDPTIESVFLSGIAGSGKTLLAYMAGLKQTLVNDVKLVGKHNISLYDIIRLFKVAIGPDDYAVGFLPGDLADKQKPLMASFAHIHNTELNGINFFYEKALEIQQPNFYQSNGGKFAPTKKLPLVAEEAVAYIKGMTYKNSFIIVDEMQDARTRVAKGILTRPGKGSKIVVCGDPEQIDNRFLLPDKNGLVYAAKGMIKLQNPFTSMMHLPVSSRGNTSMYAGQLPNRRE